MNDVELLTAFESQSISNDDWSHTYHVRIGFIYLSSHEFDKALELVKSGIKKLNKANQVPESQFRGFHETLTVGWLKLIDSQMRKSKFNSSIHLLEKFHELLNSRLLSEYYSPDRLMSLEAKESYIEPDLKDFA